MNKGFVRRFTTHTTLIICFLYGSQVHSASFKCGKHFAKTGMTSAQIKQICGAPQYKTQLKKNFRQDYWPKGRKSLWQYKTTKGGYFKHLYFVDGILKQIDNGRRVE
ncbi:hypothetical protein C2869_04915 [Saccharobesus litoralis]|uniref:DUF2845 domain-containing protein n=1 Tax=Saccharobesus litoralis TaxID=2172099 RepID=A0A2S0VNL2_9ALTE|nr:DUF2845 domain-containing protein [Saccharobesus litoralis]AWB65821.1 hypothetical protein C2869_04915 [Saccharobesus litoralis]